MKAARVSWVTYRVNTNPDHAARTGASSASRLKETAAPNASVTGDASNAAAGTASAQVIGNPLGYQTK